MESTAKATTNQPQAAIQMSVVNPAPANNNQNHQEHHAKRLRGGGAAKDCFIGALECFLCFECCKVIGGDSTSFGVNLTATFISGLLRMLRRYHLLPLRDVLLNALPP
ncbi:hypothetical protein DEU56DRAFT_978679 [Suillus clintonianus]|uniref:uncharacterized protein n=1 Tax=Suillus clintonianus TaxID=1904413 RepID=UPI001B877175|nr:uncharacterized protein DEU56DRAFT_978679 [Suillus clintonianus]KAG2146828.1 hypothetical protein DEU56DRAFT_978679 [Suillus clintonianus]